MPLSPDLARRYGSRFALILLGSLYVFTFLYSYQNVDSVMLSWIGLTFGSPGRFWTVLSLIMAILPTLWMPIALKRPSQFALWMIYVMVVVPAMVVPFRALQRDPADIFVFSAVLLSCFFALCTVCRLPTFVVPRPEIKPLYVYVTVGAMTLAFTVAVWYTAGFTFDLGFTNLYDRRLSAREEFAQQSMVAYIKGNLASALAPFAMMLGVIRKKWFLVAAGAFGLLIIFATEGSRTAAFLPVFVFAAAPLLFKYREKFGYGMLAGITALLVLSILLFTFFDNIFAPAIISWRMLIAKGLLTGYYWDFFSTHDFVYYGDGILRNVMGNPYDAPVPRLIGQVYFNSDQMNSNANIFAAAYGDFGFPGMVFITAATTATLRFIDSLSHNRDFLVTTIICGFVGFKWTDAAFDTAIFSHGVLLALLLIYLTPKAEAEKPPEYVPALSETPT